MCDKITAKIKQYANDDIFIIFYSDYCGYCKNAIEMLKTKNKSFKGYDIEQIKGGLDRILYCFSQNSEELEFNITHKTRPVIFYKGKFIGGFTDLQKMLDK